MPEALVLTSYSGEHYSEPNLQWLSDSIAVSRVVDDSSLLSKRFSVPRSDSEKVFAISKSAGESRVETIFREDSSTPLFETIKQKWSGVITDFNESEIFAILQDLTDPSNPKEEVVLFREELDPADQSLVSKGAEFFWHIGYREGVNSPRERFSKIRLRRFPKWTKAELESSTAFAKKYASLFSTSS